MSTYQIGIESYDEFKNYFKNLDLALDKIALDSFCTIHVYKELLLQICFDELGLESYSVIISYQGDSNELWYLQKACH